MSFEDKTLACRDCGNAFTFTAGEQEFYEQKGFTNEPQRCRDCRQARKQRGDAAPADRPNPNAYSSNDGYTRPSTYGSMSRGNEYGSMSRGNEYGNNDRGNAGSQGNEYGNMRGSASSGNQRYGNESYPRQERVQHETVCAQCGRPTTVPFVPRAGRPVYCQECFAQRRGPAAERGPRRDNGFNRF